MANKSSICCDCSNNKTCNLTDNQESINSCSEFEPAKTFLNLIAVPQHQKTLKETFSNLNLCSTCTIQHDCIFKEDKRPILHCELYQ